MTTERIEQKHSPGPWKVYGREGGFGFTIEATDEDGDEFPVVWEMGGIDDEANARLIAAAPELLAALERLIEFGGHVRGCKENPCSVDCILAREAIKKATEV
jgi:hypothetical protein